jgi:hypothetical protein
MPLQGPLDEKPAGACNGEVQPAATKLWRHLPSIVFDGDRNMPDPSMDRSLARNSTSFAART